MNFFSANRIFFYTLSVIFFITLSYALFFRAPADFPVEVIFKIERGDSLRSVSLRLKETRIIRSRLVFEVFVILFGKEKGVVRADYYFKEKLSVWSVAGRVAKGEHHLAPIMVTIPEGFNSLQIADTFVSKLANFNKSKFLLDVADLEGYLFPDTYFFFRTDTETDVIKSMRANFQKKITPLRLDIISYEKTEKEIIIMASIIEGEAKGDADRGIIAGILWKRLSIGMPLQVDVALETYKTKGLPKSPVNNPGIKSIKAAIAPQKSSFLYYLHDKNGDIHYAKNFSEHLQNIQKYLK